MPGGHASASRLLELNLLSARDLATVSKSMKTFAVAWIDQDRKLETRTDQTGQNNPAWNEKFAFRVDDDFLIGESSTITIEIRALTRRGNVVLVGTVSVLVASLFPRSTTSSQKRSFSKMRFLTLQIRRPSGRPQGVLDVGVALLDGTRRSMPLSSDVSASGYGTADMIDTRSDKERRRKSLPNMIKLRRSKSDRSISESYLLKPTNGSLISCSDLRKGKESPCSDVGPSPSVVAAAIAIGRYPAKAKDSRAAADEMAESSILEDWTEEDDSVEGLKTKIERWRSEIHPLYQSQYKKNMSYHRENYNQSTHRRNEPAKKELRRGGSGLFSCFGNAYGCEFSITCGGGSSRRKSRLDGGDEVVHLSLSEIHYNDPYARV